MLLRNNWILLPLVIQAALALEAYVALAMAKSRAAKMHAVDVKRAALDDSAWPDRVRQINNNIRNQFEVPVLFYVMTIILWQLNAAGPLAQTLAWLFVGSRVVHAFVHTGRNYVPLRLAAFLFGCVMVAGMGVLVAVTALKPAGAL